MLHQFDEALCSGVAGALRPMIEGQMESGLLNRSVFHMIFGVRHPESPWFKEIYSTRFGTQDPSQWEWPYDEIATSKASITGRTGLPSRIVQLEKPHLLLPGDTLYWGSWIEGDYLVAASGVQSYFDEYFSKMALYLALAMNENTRAKLEEAAEAQNSCFFPRRQLCV